MDIMNIYNNANVLEIKDTLRVAVVQANVSTLSNLLNQHNFNIFFPIDMTGNTLLHFAVLQSKVKVVEFLCANMNEVDVRDWIGRTPLHLAVTKNESEIVKIILASGADVNLTTLGGDTPLIKTIYYNQPKNARLLLRFGADSSIGNKLGNSPLTLSRQLRRIECEQCIRLYTEIEVFFFIKPKKKSDEKNFVNKLSPDKLKKLIRFIIP